MPATEAFAEWNGMTRLFAPKCPLAAAGQTRNDGLNDEARNVVHVPGSMAIHAFGRPAHDRPSPWLQPIENVKDAADFWIDRDDLDAAPRDEADVSVIIEIQRSRIAGRDESLLQASRREDEHLGTDGHIQFFQQAAQKRQITAQIDRKRLSFVPRVEKPRKPVVDRARFIPMKQIVNSWPRP